MQNENDGVFQGGTSGGYEHRSGDASFPCWKLRGSRVKVLEEMMLKPGLEAVDVEQPWAGPGSVKPFPSQGDGMCKGPVAGRHCHVLGGD